MTDDRSSILPAHITDAPALADMPSVEAAQEAQRAKLVSLEENLSEMYEYLRMAGMAAGILRGSELLWFIGYGFADLAEKTAVTRDTPFHLASLTKTFASTLLMQLVEQGKLDLDTPAATFGIDLKSRGTITVRHLFSHTSGGKTGRALSLRRITLRSTRPCTQADYRPQLQGQPRRDRHPSASA